METTIILVGEDQQVIDMHRVDSLLPALAEMRTISFTEKERGVDSIPLNRMRVYEVLGHTQSLELVSESDHPFTIEDIVIFMKVKELVNIGNIEYSDIDVRNNELRQKEFALLLQEDERIHGVKLPAKKDNNEGGEKV